MPKAIYEIPVSSPSHAVTYVTVEESNDDAVVFATAAAFTGVMVAWGCVVWGTGYYYPPYYGSTAGTRTTTRTIRPTDSAPPTTRGPAPTRAAPSAYGPYGGAGVAQRYNPRTGTYSRGAVAYGPYGARGAAHGLQPAHRRLRRDPTGLERLRQLGIDRRPARRSVGHHLALHQQPTGKTTRVTQGERWRRGHQPHGAAGNGSTVGRTGSGDVYAGHDGNVYRKQGDSWQKYGDGGWSGVEQPTPQQREQAPRIARTGRRAGIPQHGQQVTRDSAARAEGSRRTTDSSRYRSGGGTSSTGSYRGGGYRGGGGRGGGGRRR